MKKIMIIGATSTQVPLINAAKEMGYYTIVTSTDGNYPGFDVADEKCFADITNPKAVYEKAKELNIDGIATCCMDMGVRSVGYVCEKMGLCGLTEKAAVLSNDKLLMKKAFEEYGVKSPKFFKIETEKDLKEKWEMLPKPVIIKAVDLQASRGVYVCNEYEEVINAYNSIKQLTREKYCLLEQFVKGIDIGAQAFVYNEEILFVLPHNDEVYVGDANKPIGHSAPLIADEETVEEVILQCKKAIKAMGLNNCAVNIDLIKTDNNEIYMIELTGRVGATCLPELVSIYYGLNYYKMIVAMAMGEDPRVIFDAKENGKVANASRFVMSNKTGKIMKLAYDFNDPDLVLLDMYVTEGDMAKKFEDGKDRLGQVVVKGNDLDSCFSKLDEIINKIVIDIE